MEYRWRLIGANRNRQPAGGSSTTSPFVLLTCLIFVAIGWMVARLHRRHLPGIVVVFSATLLIPAAFQALEARRLLETELWPGWGWGSFRWALVFHALVSIVAYPLSVLLGGLWTLRTDADTNCDVDPGTVLKESQRPRAAQSRSTVVGSRLPQGRY